MVIAPDVDTVATDAEGEADEVEPNVDTAAGEVPVDVMVEVITIDLFIVIVVVAVVVVARR